MSIPEISVIMSTYNEKRTYLEEAIESIRKQTFKNFEFLIVLDNPNNEEIRQCIYEYALADQRIKVIVNEENIGLTKSLNKAIAVAKGKYMSRMDADDIMIATCLERELQIMKKENLDLVAASKKNIDENGKVLDVFVNDFSPKQMKWLLPYDNSINHPTVLVRMEIVRQLNGYREIRSCEDYDLWIRMLCYGCRMRLLPSIFLLRRMRSDGVCESNAHQLYRSKRFVMMLYRKGKKNLLVLDDMSKYEQYMIKRESVMEQKRFNEAYELLYKGITLLKRREIGKFLVCYCKAIRKDRVMFCIFLNKLLYQMRRYMVIKLVR